MWGELASHKRLFNLPAPVLKAGHPESCSCVVVCVCVMCFMSVSFTLVKGGLGGGTETSFYSFFSSIFGWYAMQNNSIHCIQTELQTYTNGSPEVTSHFISNNYN